MTSCVPQWQNRLSIIIPAFNEEGGIGSTLQGLKRDLPDAEIIVVDDGSSDATAERAGAVEGVTVCHHPFNRGYGAALKTGMWAATRDYLAWFDADNEHRVEDLVRMVDRLEATNLAAVIGQRPTGVSRYRAAGKFLIRMFALALGMRPGSDLNCGLRVFQRGCVLPYLALLPNKYSASMTSTMVLLERGYPMEFVPIHTQARIGTSKVALGDGFHAFVLILRMIMLFAPLRIFLAAGGALIATGVGYGLAKAWSLGLGMPVLSMILVVTGVVLILQGLIADQISTMRLGQLEENSRRAAPPPVPPTPALTAGRVAEPELVDG